MRLRKVWEDIESSLWFRPMIWMIGFGLLAVLLIAADRRYLFQQSNLEIPWFLVGGAEGARTMLGAIASAMLTVTSLAFSLMMVTVVQTANAYSPRILRQYLADKDNQHVLGILIGTFLYSLLVLRSVRSGEDSEFVPVLATNGALVLSLLSTAALIYFINHVAQSIKVGNIIQLILDNTEYVVEAAFPREIGQPWQRKSPPTLPSADPVTILSEETGYIQLFDHSALMQYATEHQLVIEVTNMVGDFVLRGTPLVRIWGDKTVDEELAAVIQRTFILGTERTFSQDLRFGIRQLADIALRALSPGINDPTTAVNAINSLATLLAQVIERGPVSPYRCDAEGRLRVAFPDLSFHVQLEEAFTQIIHYGAADFAVIGRLIEVFGQIGYLVKSEAERHTLWQLTLNALNQAADQITSPIERRKLNDCFRRTAAILGRDADPFSLDIHADARAAEML